MTRDIAWSYGGDPAASPMDAVRFAIGDVVDTDPLLSDQEVAYLLAQYDGDVALAAIYGLEALIMQYARAVDESVGAVSISFSQRLTNLKDTLSLLRQRYTLNAGFRPISGGMSYADKQLNQASPDNVRPCFRVHERYANGCGIDIQGLWPPGRGQ